MAASFLQTLAALLSILQLSVFSPPIIIHHHCCHAQTAVSSSSKYTIAGCISLDPSIIGFRTQDSRSARGMAKVMAPTIFIIIFF